MIIVCDTKTRKEKKIKTPYELNHKYIDGIEYKLCFECDQWHPLNDEWFYKNKSSPDGFHPYCKEKAKEKSRKRMYENYELHKMKNKTYREDNIDYYHEKFNQWYLENKNYRYEYMKEWQQNNPDKLKEYRFDRLNKQHEISDEEKYKCKEYFNFSCAYCNIPEELHKEINGQQLHMDHVDPNGANDLSNNVPACRSCNSKKGDRSLEHFYTVKEVSQVNKNKIIKWLDSDYKKYIKSKNNNK